MPKPNILMITCHDIGQHLGCYGVKTVHTPNLDALAVKGVRFQNFYSTSAVCSPARGSLHTGRYPQSNGLMGLTHAPWWWQMKESERHTASLLKELGYRTILIGFNHIDPAPGRLGYQHILSENKQAPETVAATENLIRRSSPGDIPWFAKVGFTEVHRPFRHGTESSKDVFIPPWLQDTDDIRDDLAAFQATIQYFDQQVGEILDTLIKSTIADQTLVIMTSDHGIPYPGAKWTVRKAGIEIPLILYQPDTLFSGGHVYRSIMSNVDVLPTLLHYLGGNIPQNIQGISFMDFLSGDTESAPRKYAFSQYTPEMKRDNTSRSVITERYHLIRYFDAGRTVEYPVDVHPQTFANHEQRCRAKATRPFAQLFDLLHDPYELQDIGSLAHNSDIVGELSTILLRWMEDVGDPLLEGPLRTPYYNSAMDDFIKATHT